MSSSRHTGFLACRDCGVALPVRLHLAPEPQAAFQAAFDDATNAYNEFLVHHHEHRTTQLLPRGTTSVTDRPLWDPMATITFEATDGQHVYLVTAARAAIEEPRVYRVTLGTLAAGTAAVDVDVHLLQRALDREFSPHALRASKLDRFVSLLREIIDAIDPEQLTVAFDDADDPAVSIAAMPEATYRELLSRVAEIFDPWEMGRVASFLGKHRDADGLLALRVRRYPVALTA